MNLAEFFAGMLVAVIIIAVVIFAYFAVSSRVPVPASVTTTTAVQISSTSTVPTASSTSTVPTTTIAPPPPGTSESLSVNWAGYVAETSFANPASLIDSVEGAWNIPAVNCTGTSSEYSSAFWIGIDGFDSNSVEQIGTDSDCYQGQPSYYAWYEMYPNYGVTLDIPISSGDEVNTKVEYIGNNQFRLSINNTANNGTFSVSETSSIARRNSAEWIAEAPTLNNRILPLSRFGPVDFMKCYVTVNGQRGPIGSSGWESRAIVMSGSGGTIKATPSALSGDGTGFTITWEHR